MPPENEPTPPNSNASTLSIEEIEKKAEALKKALDKERKIRADLKKANSEIFAQLDGKSPEEILAELATMREKQEAANRTLEEKLEIERARVKELENKAAKSEEEKQQAIAANEQMRLDNAIEKEWVKAGGDVDRHALEFLVLPALRPHIRLGERGKITILNKDGEPRPSLKDSKNEMGFEEFLETIYKEVPAIERFVSGRYSSGAGFVPNSKGKGGRGQSFEEFAAERGYRKK